VVVRGRLGSGAGYTITLQPVSSASWQADDGAQWTVPLMLRKETRVGRRPNSLQIGGGWFARQPTGGPEWKLRANLGLLFPA
jgi:hypothetical protein